LYEWFVPREEIKLHFLKIVTRGAISITTNFFSFGNKVINWNMNSFSCLKTCKLLNKVYMRLLTYNQPFKGCLSDGCLNYWKTLQNEKDSKWFFHGSKIAWKRPLLVILNVTTFNYLIKLPPKKVQPWCKRLFPLSKHTTSLHVQ